MGRVAVVTGGDTGISYTIVKSLCQQFDGTVYLTAPDITRGLIAVNRLEKFNLKPKFHQLDITDDESVTKFRDYLKNTYDGLDVLINNAAIAFKTDATELDFGIQAEETIRVNYFGLRRVCTALYPLLRPHARVVHVSGSDGYICNITGNTLKERLSNPNLTKVELDKIMHEFVNAAKSNTHVQAGWSNSTYLPSKIGICALTGIHQSMFNVDSRKDIAVNAVHLHYICISSALDLLRYYIAYKETGMTHTETGMSHTELLTPDGRLVGPVYFALLPENTEIKGKYIWYNTTLPNWK